MVTTKAFNLLSKEFLTRSILTKFIGSVHKLNWLIIVILLCGGIVNGQQFNIKRVELADQKVTVHYDLTDTVKSRTYSISVYRSNDNYLNPLQQVTGDIGREVKPGINKKFSWDAQTELGAEFSGSVSLEIRGKLYIPFVRFDGFNEYKVIKRLKPYEVTWSGGTSQNILNFDLYKGEKKVLTIPNIANVGHYKLTLPKDVKPGKDYRFRISDTKNKDEVVETGNFIVKRKTPLLLKILPVVALGVGVTFLAGGGDDGPKNIPDPIEPN
jgi:hypothetical protein